MPETRLPPLPVDDVALDLYWSAVRPEQGRSSLREVLDLYSQLGGSDLDAIGEVLREDWTGPTHVEMRDPKYHPNDLIAALITEIRRLRSGEVADHPESQENGASAYVRAVLIDVLIDHRMTPTSGCACGGVGLGESWPEHVADVYEDRRPSGV